MKRLLIVPILAGSVLLGAAAPAQAAASSSGIGAHVACMAPEHPIAHGAMFGACVKSLALRQPCPHH